MTQEVTSTHPWQESHCHLVQWLMMVITTFYWGWFNFNKNVKHLRTTRTTKTKWLYFRTAVTLMKRFCKENPVERIGYQKDGVHDIKKHRWFQVRRKFLLWNSLLHTAMVLNVDVCIISMLFTKIYQLTKFYLHKAVLAPWSFVFTWGVMSLYWHTLLNSDPICLRW